MARNIDACIDRLEEQLAGINTEIREQQGLMAKCFEGTFEHTQAISKLNQLRRRASKLDTELNELYEMEA